MNRATGKIINSIEDEKDITEFGWVNRAREGDKVLRANFGLVFEAGQKIKAKRINGTKKPFSP